ncbi:MAG: VCBS repeat-containing protein, partial [candidate division WOR-3 bacterium]|nr:VCBS repeat-containing protein [candidate division WOR-3 bacterium]
MVKLLILLFIFLKIFSQQIRFRDVARELGINVSGGLGACCAFFDYNNDNYLDILFNPGERIYLFRNNGGVNFTNITDSAGLNNYEFRNLVIGDYNNDGYLDILANSHGSDCYLFRNNGNNTFTEVSASLGLTSGGYRSLFLDYNRDGYLDVLIIREEASYLYQQENGIFQIVHNFINGNTGTVFDYNNDLYPDIYIGRNGENKLYKNVNGDTFLDVTSIAGVGNTGETQGVVSGDFDNQRKIRQYLEHMNWIDFSLNIDKDFSMMKTGRGMEHYHNALI